MTTQTTSRCWRGAVVSQISLVLLGVTMLGGDCRPIKRSATGPGAGTAAAAGDRGDKNLPVATIGESVITVGMVESELNRQNPYLRMRFASPERRKDFLKNMVRFEVLAREASSRGLQRDPEVVQRVKRAMIDRLMEQLHGTLVKMDSITDQEVADYYKQNLAVYQQPARVRVSWILVGTEAEAAKLLEEAKRNPTDIAFFGELALKHSIDEATKAKRGDLDFFNREAKNVPKEIVEAAFAMKGLWKLGGPVKTDKGYAVMMKTGELEAVSRTLEQEKDRIRSRVYNERRLKAMEKFVLDLQAKAKVQIDEKALAKVKVDLSAKSPASGFHGQHPH